MKIITAMIQPFMLNKVTYALEDITDFPGMTVTEARGFGHKQRPEEQRVPHYDPFHPKARIEIVALDEMVEVIVKTIAEHARTGKDGDGKIFVLSVEQAVRVQTSETNEAAI